MKGCEARLGWVVNGGVILRGERRVKEYDSLAGVKAGVEVMFKGHGVHSHTPPINYVRIACFGGGKEIKTFGVRHSNTNKMNVCLHIQQNTNE